MMIYKYNTQWGLSLGDLPCLRYSPTRSTLLLVQPTHNNIVWLTSQIWSCTASYRTLKLAQLGPTYHTIHVDLNMLHISIHVNKFSLHEFNYHIGAYGQKIMNRYISFTQHTVTYYTNHHALYVDLGYSIQSFKHKHITQSKQAYLNHRTSHTIF